jgi:hypothetical protein
MTPAAIIKAAAAEGVTLALTPAATIKASGDGTAVNRWLPIIREHKPGVVAALQQALNDEALPAPATETRRQRVLKMLADNPALRLAVVCDGAGDPVPVAVAIREKGSVEILIPAARFDPFALLELVEQHTVH